MASAPQPELKERAVANRSAAAQIFRRKVAEDIVPLANKLLHTAHQAGLTTSQAGVTAFKGKNYTVQHQEVAGSQKVEVFCRQSKGYIRAVNGKIERADKVTSKDCEVFSIFAKKTPQQLKATTQKHQATKNNGFSH